MFAYIPNTVRKNTTKSYLVQFHSYCKLLQYTFDRTRCVAGRKSYFSVLWKWQASVGGRHLGAPGAYLPTLHVCLVVNCWSFGNDPSLLRQVRFHYTISRHHFQLYRNVPCALKTSQLSFRCPDTNLKVTLTSCCCFCVGRYVEVST